MFQQGLQLTWVGNNQKYSIWTVFYEIWNDVYKQHNSTVVYML